MLIEMGQSHLFEHWAEPGVDDDKKKGFFEQVGHLDCQTVLVCFDENIMAYIPFEEFVS